MPTEVASEIWTTTDLEWERPDFVTQYNFLYLPGN
jgi:hypothetical protein